MASRAPAFPRLLSTSRPRLQSKLPRHHRYASTSSNPPSNRLRNFIYGSTTVAIVSIGYLYVTDTRASLHRYISPAIIRVLYPDAEEAHHFGTRLMQELWTLGLYPRERGSSLDEKLAVEVFGHTLPNPLGISGGLDKNAAIPDALFAIGPSIVEIGGVTPLAQVGNAKPRVFRLASQDAIINRYGLNSEGADAVAMRLRHRVREYAYKHGLGIDGVGEDLVLNGSAGVPPGSLTRGKLLAVQIAKNKLTPDDNITAVVRDHVICVEKLGKYADILVVNVSSPNTPGLRSLQSKAPLTKILSAVVDAANATDRETKPAVMVKVSPDENSESQVRGICEAVWESGVAGVIVGNTTTTRPHPLPAGYLLPADEARLLLEAGGYSGPQLFQRTKELVSKYRKILDEGPSEDTTVQKDTPKPTPAPPKTSVDDATITKNIEASTARDLKNLKPMDEKSATGQGRRGREIGAGGDIPQRSSESHPILRIPERHTASSDTSSSADMLAPYITQSASSSTAPFTGEAPAESNKASGIGKALNSSSKVIFASGGITNGEQALEVLNAGASVAMCYTAVVYGGVGTISRIKGEMQEKLNARGSK